MEKVSRICSWAVFFLFFGSGSFDLRFFGFALFLFSKIAGLNLQSGRLILKPDSFVFELLDLLSLLLHNISWMRDKAYYRRN